MSWYDPRDWWAPAERSDSGRIGDIPLIGDIHKGIWGDPEGIKDAYNAQIQASKDAQMQLQQFLMGKKGEAQAFYAPMQHMFQKAYGTEGIRGPQIPSANTGQLNRYAGGK